MRIDWWTLALQTVNVLILVWILARFFFRPIMDLIGRRQEEANKLIADAARARQEAVDVRADADTARAKIGAERERLIAEARNAAQHEKQSLLAQSSEEIAKRHAEAEAAIARDRAAAEAAIIDRASSLSVEIAQRLLARFPHQEILYAFVDEICREARALSPETRESLAAAAASDHPVEVLTAVPLSEEETLRVRGALSKAFGVELRFVFRNDPAIISGIEIKGQNAIIRNSWRADLDRIRQELSRVGHARQS
jgi:F-type H+-transporting ATPase subunit b